MSASDSRFVAIWASHEARARLWFRLFLLASAGMALSLVGMGFAAAGYLPPVWGAVTQEAIDVVAVLNALRAGFAPKVLRDY